MQNLKAIIVAGLIAVTSFSSDAAPSKELFWDELIPKGHVQLEQQDASSHNENSQASWVQPGLDAPVVQELNGKTVSIPGFVVPLEGDDELITEFLLVPYFGACIHVPPPPPNQIVHVIIKDGVPIDSLYDAIVVTGELSTKGWSGEIAEVGYTMKGIGVAPFEG
jgi:hypothetical protein